MTFKTSFKKFTLYILIRIVYRTLQMVLYAERRLMDLEDWRYVSKAAATRQNLEDLLQRMNKRYRELEL